MRPPQAPPWEGVCGAGVYCFGCIIGYNLVILFVFYLCIICVCNIFCVSLRRLLDRTSLFDELTWGVILQIGLFYLASENW